MNQRKSINWVFHIGRRDFLDEELFVRFLAVNAPGVAVENVSVGDFATTFTASAADSNKILALNGSRFNAKSLYVHENRQRVDAAEAGQKGRRKGACRARRPGGAPARSYGAENRSERRGERADKSKSGMGNAHGARTRGSDEAHRSGGRQEYGYPKGRPASSDRQNFGVSGQRSRRPRVTSPSGAESEYTGREGRSGPQNRKGAAERRPYVAGSGRLAGTRNPTGKDGRGVADGSAGSLGGENLRRAKLETENGAGRRKPERVERYQDGGERPVKAPKKRPVFEEHGVEYVHDPIREGGFRPRHRVDINKD